MKNLEFFKNEVAKENGYSGYSEAETRFPVGIDTIFNNAAERYAAYMCKEQRKLCAEHSRLHFYDGFNKTGEQLKYFQSGADYLRVDEDSILNAPLATDKNK